MKRELLCAVFSLVLICGCLTACSNKEKTDETYASYEHEDNLEESGDEEIEEKVADAAILEETAVEETAVEAVDFEQVILPAYERYVRENFATTDSRPYSFIFLNDDEIPELVVEGDCHAAGNLICTYINDSVVSMRTGRLNFNFLQKQNLLCNSDGNTGHYYDVIYSIQNGEFICLAEGVWQEARDEEGKRFFEENGFFDYDYYWNGQMVSCEEYDNLLNQIYDTEKAVDKYDFIFYSSIQEAYENIGNTNFSEFSCHITNFELVNGVLTVENDSGKKISCSVAETCTWEQTSGGLETPTVCGTWTYEELKESIDAARTAYIENDYKHVSSGLLVIEMEEDVIERIYTVSS